MWYFSQKHHIFNYRNGPEGKFQFSVSLVCTITFMNMTRFETFAGRVSEREVKRLHCAPVHSVRVHWCTVHNARVQSPQCTRASAPFPDYVTWLAAANPVFYVVVFAGFQGKNYCFLFAFMHEGNTRTPQMTSPKPKTSCWGHLPPYHSLKVAMIIMVIVVILVIMIIIYKILIDKCSGSRWPSAPNLLSGSRGRRRIKRN